MKKKVIVDFGDGKKIEFVPEALLLHSNECIRVSLNADGHPEIARAKYDELECRSGG